MVARAEGRLRETEAGAVDIEQQDFPAEFATPAMDCLLACSPYLPPEIERVVLRYVHTSDGDVDVAANVDVAWRYREAVITLHARFFTFGGDSRLEMMLHEITHIHNRPHDRLVGSRILPRVPAGARSLLEELVEEADEYRTQGIARGIVRLLQHLRGEEPEKGKDDDA